MLRFFGMERSGAGGDRFLPLSSGVFASTPTPKTAKLVIGKRHKTRGQERGFTCRLALCGLRKLGAGGAFWRGLLTDAPEKRERAHHIGLDHLAPASLDADGRPRGGGGQKAREGARDSEISGGLRGGELRDVG